MALRPDLARRPGYQELYRELIRSQIHSLIQQLQSNGEESFFMSAAVVEPCKYVFGSEKALVYMADYTGVQKGFLPFLQRAQPDGFSVSTSPSSTSIFDTSIQTSATQQSGSGQIKLAVSHESGNFTTTVKSPLSSQAISDSPNEFSESHVGSQKENKELKREIFEGLNNEEHDMRRQRSERTPESKSVIDLRRKRSERLPESVTEVDPRRQRSERTLESFTEVDPRRKRSERMPESVTEVDPRRQRSERTPESFTEVDLRRKRSERSPESVTEVDPRRQRSERTPESFTEVDPRRKRSERMPESVTEVDPTRKRSERMPESVTEVSSVNQSVTDSESGLVISSVSGGVMDYESFVQNTNENHHSGNDNKMENKDNFLHSVPNESEADMDISSNTDNDSANAVSNAENNESVVTSNEEIVTESVAENVIDDNSDNDSAEEFSDQEYNDSDFDEMEQEEILSGVKTDKMKEKEKAKTSKDVENDSEKVDSNTFLNRRLSKRPAETNMIRRLRKQNYGVGQTKEELKKLKEQTKLRNVTVVYRDTETGISVSKGHRYLYKSNIISINDVLTEADKTCKYCQKICRTLKELREHEGSHSKKYTCYKCGLDEASQAALREHNEKCFAIPQFVKDFIRDNPNYTPKRQTTKKVEEKSSNPGKQSNGPVEQSVQQAEKLNVPKTPNNKKPVNKDSESSSSISVNQREDKMLHDQQKQIFTCSKCKKKFKLRMLLKKHQCRGDNKMPALSCERNAGDRALSGERNAGDRALSGERNEGDRDLSVERNAGDRALSGDRNASDRALSGDRNAGDRALSGDRNACDRFSSGDRNAGDRNAGAKISDITVDKFYKYEYLKTLPIVDKTCPVPECGKKLSCVTAVKDHLVTHTNERPFRCQQCKKEFRIKKELKFHMKKLHSSVLSKVDRIKVMNTKLKSFKSKNLLTKVPKIYNKGNNKKLEEKSRNYKCNYCEKKFLCKSHLEEHIVVHTGEKNFQCSQCKTKLLYRCTFKSHKKKCDAAHPGQDCIMIKLKARYKLSGKNVAKKIEFTNGFGTEQDSGNIQEDGANSTSENRVSDEDIFAEETGEESDTNDSQMKTGTASKSNQNAQSLFREDSGSNMERRESPVQKLLEYSPIKWNSCKVPYVCYKCKLKFDSGDEYINHTCNSAGTENKQ